MTIKQHLQELILCVLFISALPIAVPLIVYLKIKKYFENDVANKKNISGEVAVITGSARGLGRNIAIELAKRGCRIAVVDIRGALAEETAKYLIQTYGVKAKAYEVDVSDYQQLVDLQQNVTKDLGHTTILINNAAILLLPQQPKPEEVQKMINVNLAGVYFANSIFLPKMKELKRGYILAVSSLSALFPTIELDLYAAIKSALRILLTAQRVALRNEYKNIKLTTVMPYFMTSNKLIEELMKYTLVPKLLEFFDSQTVARIAVEAMLNGEEELTVPRLFLYFYKVKELLPAAIFEIVMGIIRRTTASNIFERPECQEIYERRNA